MEVVNPELHQMDGEVLAKAEELGKAGVIDIRERQDAFVFRVQGTGALPAEDVVLTALDVLGAKLQTISVELERENSEFYGHDVL